MPHLSASNRQDIERLKEQYRSLSWYAKLFFPAKVSAALFRGQCCSFHEIIQALDLCIAVLNETSPIQRGGFSFFSSCLEVFSSSGLINNFAILSDASLLTGDAARANRYAVAGHQYPYGVVNALRALTDAGLLTRDVAQANFNVVAGHESPHYLVDALRTLNDAGLLAGDGAQANFNAVAGYKYPSKIADSLRLLSNAGLLTGDITQANRDAVKGHQYPGRINDALHRLNNAGLLTGDTAQANFNAVAGSEYPYSVAGALCILNDAGLLTRDVAQANRDAVTGHQDQYAVARTLAHLTFRGLLRGGAAQANFNAVIMHSILLDDEMIDLWRRIPDHRFTQARFAALIEICQRHADNHAAGRDLVFADIAREIIGMNEPAAAAEGPRLNAGQSTHTASVHQTVSESATKLMVHYGTQLSGDGLHTKTQELSTWLNAQPDASIKIAAAKRCLQRLAAEGYDFVDRSSRVSTKQLLALFWIAIHDDKLRTGDLDDAKLKLVEGLYEIQREYNLSEIGEEDGADIDIPSCPAGTFNKIIEKGCGVHPKMMINFISQAGFALKLPRVVSEEAMAYLRSNDNSKVGILIEVIKAEGNSVGPIWKAIQAIVAIRMFDEFGSLFGNNIKSSAFVEAIANGVYTSLNSDNLSALEQLIHKESPEGGAMAATMPHPGSFFASARSANAEENAAPKAPYR